MSLPASSHQEIMRATQMLLKALGCDVKDSNFKGTPKRVADLYSTILDGNFCKVAKITKFEAYAHDGIVIVHKVPFYAFCAHHLLPFFGHFSVGYLPRCVDNCANVLGLSKLIRLVRHGSKVPTTQESFVAHGIDAVANAVGNDGVILSITAEHMCMTLRGAKSPGCVTITTNSNGAFITNTALRTEFLSQIK